MSFLSHIIITFIKGTSIKRSIIQSILKQRTKIRSNANINEIKTLSASTSKLLSNFTVLRIAWKRCFLLLHKLNEYFFNTTSNAHMILGSVTASLTIKPFRQNWKLVGLSKSFELWFVAWFVVSFASSFIAQLDSESTVILPILPNNKICYHMELYFYVSALSHVHLQGINQTL